MAATAGERQDEAGERAADLLGDVEESWRAARDELEPDAYWLLRGNLEAAILRIER